VPAVLHDRHAAAIDRADRGIVGREDPVIDHGVVREAVGLEHDEVGTLSGRYGVGSERGLEQAPAGRARRLAQHVALAAHEALAVFERAQLVGGGDADVRI
jgi:hypothetical protein